MSKVNIKRLDSVTKNDTTATEQINDNFRALQEAIENTLSRDGTTPNYMDADLDMNSYRIINSADPVEDNDIVNLKYVEERIGGAVEASKTAVNAAAQAATSAQSALVSSTNAINTLTNAEAQLNIVIKYVDDAKQDIDNTINDALADVKQQALDAAQESIDTAAEQATTIVIEHAENVIKPELTALATAADEDATSAAESARVARVWAEGGQAEVEPIGGSLSSMGAADLAYAIANAPEDTPIDTAKMFALNIFKGEKGDKGDKGDAGKDGRDGGEFDAVNFLNLIYPIGSIYITTTSTCPIQDFGIGTWELVARDRVLQGAGTRGTVGTELAESLPNISGRHCGSWGTDKGRTGAFSGTWRTGEVAGQGRNFSDSGNDPGWEIQFNASLSSSAYQDGAPVQPDAYLVNIFRRVL